MSPLESAIPAELTAERTCPHAMPQDWTPPYPSYSARFEPTRSTVGMLILGVQGEDTPTIRDELQQLVTALMTRTAEDPEVQFRDQAEFVDAAGQLNRIVVCYFRDTEAAVTVSEQFSRQWVRETASSETLGFFAEQIWPTMDRVETLYSSDHVQGVAQVATGLSGEIREHGYWGSARDRFAVAQRDRLDPIEGQRHIEGEVVTVSQMHNVCLIRSGQDWSETTGAERAMYLEEVEPVLREGMDFLLHDGASIGCVANRYVRVLDDEGAPRDQSYGMSWWRSLADLDRWAKDHPTHQSIFGAALRYLGEHGGSGHLKLTHEVFVIERGYATFRYRNCHAGTGLLAGFSA